MDNNRCLRPNVDCYSYDKMFIGEKSIIILFNFTANILLDYVIKDLYQKA